MAYLTISRLPNMNPYRENKLLWGMVDELGDVLISGINKFNQVSAEKDHSQKEADSLKQENKVLWEELVAQQQLIDSQQKLVESQQRLIMEMRRVGAARAQYEAQRANPRKNL